MSVKFIKNRSYKVNKVSYQGWFTGPKLVEGQVYKFISSHSVPEKEGTRTVGVFKQKDSDTEYHADIDWWHNHVSFKDCEDVTDEVEGGEVESIYAVASFNLPYLVEDLGVYKGSPLKIMNRLFREGKGNTYTYKFRRVSVVDCSAEGSELVDEISIDEKGMANITPTEEFENKIKMNKILRKLTDEEKKILGLEEKQ